MGGWDSLRAPWIPGSEVGPCHTLAHLILCKEGIETPIFTEGQEARRGNDLIPSHKPAQGGAGDGPGDHRNLPVPRVGRWHRGGA